MKFKSKLSAFKFILLLGVMPMLFVTPAILMSHQGWHIPKPDEIQRTEGTITIKTITPPKRQDLHRIMIKDVTGKSMELTCSYTPFYDSQQGGCFYGNIMVI